MPQLRFLPSCRRPPPKIRAPQVVTRMGSFCEVVRRRKQMLNGIGYSLLPAREAESRKTDTEERERGGFGHSSVYVRRKPGD
jgi:hypothetical protein